MVRCERIGLAKEVPPHHIGMSMGGGAHWSRVSGATVVATTMRAAWK
jgi:hypothetical protein